MMNILALSCNPSLLNVTMGLHAVSYPLLGSQVVPALVCFYKAGGEEKEERHEPTINQGSLYLISQGC